MALHLDLSGELQACVEQQQAGRSDREGISGDEF